MTVKLSELPDDAIIFRDDEDGIAASDARKLFADYPLTPRNFWWLGVMRHWVPDVRNMVEQYIERESECMHEGADEDMRARMETLIAQMQEIASRVDPVPYWDWSDDVEIDIDEVSV